MTTRLAGRPRGFDRAVALRRAAHLFWRHGYSATSTRMLTDALGISASSLYAAFGSKAALFDEAVRTYALRYHAIYDVALQEPDPFRAIARLLHDSVHEFTRTEDGHPGCLTSSAVMIDGSPTLDVRAFVATMQRADEARLAEHLARAAQRSVLPTTVDPAALAELVQTIWQGLSTRAELGVARAALDDAATFAVEAIAASAGVRTAAPALPA